MYSIDQGPQAFATAVTRVALGLLLKSARLPETKQRVWLNCVYRRPQEIQRVARGGLHEAGYKHVPRTSRCESICATAPSR
jgi:hypothetical protein